MHHKFLVGCENLNEPISVWMGSFNMTRGSMDNMDSAVILGPDPAKIYYHEWFDILVKSESLDFKANYVEPDLHPYYGS